MSNNSFSNFDLTQLEVLNADDNLAINGGYSWAEFKKDVSDAWNDAVDGFSRGFSNGAAAADGTK